MKKNPKAWGKYRGDKKIAILWQGNLIPENSKIYEVCDVISTSAAQRLLKTVTGQNYDIVRVEWNGDLYANDTEARKINRLLKEVL
jgi:hypothetical protein